MAEGRLPSQLPGLLTSHLHWDQAVLSQTSPSLFNSFSHFMERLLHTDTPNLHGVLSSLVPLRTHFPKADQEARARCLLASVSRVTSNKNTRAWTDFVCLAKLVLRRERGGRRCPRDLWQKPRTFFERKRETEPVTTPKTFKTMLAISHAEWRNRANFPRLAPPCSASLDEPPASYSEAVVKEIRGCHPQP